MEQTPPGNIIREGEVIGNYRTSTPLGAGAVGVVVRGEPLSGSGAPIAIKVQPPISEALGETIRITLKTATILRSITHPNVCRVYESGFLNDGRSYVSMELLSGTSLRDVLKQVRLLPEARALSIVRQLLSALAEVHKAGIIHRDIKPPNLYLVPGKDGKETVKLIDFGIAFIQGTKETGAEGSRKKVIYGTATYVSPEQIRGDSVDGRADLYAVGVLLYRLLTGSLPFPYERPADLYKAHLAEAPKKPRELNPRITPFVEAVILKALNKKPEARFQSADEFIAALDAAVKANAERRGSALSVNAPKEAPLPEDAPAAPFPLWPVGLALGVVLGLVAGVLTAPAAPAAPVLPERVSLSVESEPKASLLRRALPLGETPLTVKAKPGEWLVLRAPGRYDVAFQVGTRETLRYTLPEAPPAPPPPPEEEPSSAPTSSSAPASAPTP